LPCRWTAYDLSVRTAGEDNVAAIASVSLDLSDSALAGQARTVAAVDKGDTLGLQVYTDDVSELDAATARINVLNALAGSVLTAVLDDGTEVPVTAPFEGEPVTVEVPAGAYSLQIADATGGSVEVAMPFNGGALYSVLVAGALDEPAVITGTDALNVQPGSVVSAAPAMEAMPEASAPEATEEAPAVQPTDAPAPPPTEAPTVAPSQPTQAPVSTDFYAVVYNLNPDANLNIREYARADVLGRSCLATGSALSCTVLGRAGEPGRLLRTSGGPAGRLVVVEVAETWVSVEYVTYGRQHDPRPGPLRPVTCRHHGSSSAACWSVWRTPNRCAASSPANATGGSTRADCRPRQPRISTRWCST
jgi:hypothetical protein